ncbi:hypothetical protein B0H14DRAFT_3863187 [Mycena olivaceomarginata]|nr:hypothetical protein B0H14DRAFT_3863187 [Mycena olivaceomarginata]
MSASTSKERNTVVVIYPKPDHLSKEDFEADITSFVKAFMATPSAQKLALKKEAIYQTTQLDQYFENLGFPQRRTSVCFLYEYEVFSRSSTLLPPDELTCRLLRAWTI